MSELNKINELLARIKELEEENASLNRSISDPVKGDTVTVPEGFKPLFDAAQKTVSEYFRHLKMDPTKGTIEINDQRYVLVRASALSYDFLNTIQQLYADRGEKEAMSIGKNFLFDIAHVIGTNDAKNFHQKMNLTDPIAKLSAGPVHFAYTGWAYVDILPESSPSPDDNCYLIYNHTFSFEADSWIRAGKKADTPVCIMNSGYSSGWCEASFGIPLTAVEVTCKAKGDEHCKFIMSPPHKIHEHVERFDARNKLSLNEKITYDIPTFFERKKIVEEMCNIRKLVDESDKMKSEFLANMSHEIRTPLNGIIGFTDLLLKTQLDATQTEYVSIAFQSANSLLSIVNDILDFSKIEAGKIQLDPEDTSLGDLGDDVINLVRFQAIDKNLILGLEIDPNIPDCVWVDQLRLKQIIVNLLGNAVKFTEHGKVTFSVNVLSQNPD